MNNMEQIIALLGLISSSPAFSSAIDRLKKMIEHTNDPGAEELEQLAMDLKRIITDARASKKFEKKPGDHPAQATPPSKPPPAMPPKPTT